MNMSLIYQLKNLMEATEPEEVVSYFGERRTSFKPTEKFLKAMSYAKAKHEGQFRDGGAPYFRHIEDVIEILIHTGHTDELTLVVAALHDTVEQTSATYKEISEKFGQEAADGVKLLTRTKSEPFEIYAERIFTCPRNLAYCRDIKFADRLANLMSIPMSWKQDRVERQIAETKKCLLPYTVDSLLKEQVKRAVSLLDWAYGTKGK